MGTIGMNTKSTPHEQAALAWMARRHSGRWSARDERDWRAWMAADPAHAAAWQRVQRAWEELGGLAEVMETELPPARPAWPRPGWRWAAMLAGVAALLMIWLALPPGSFAPAQFQRTAVGEQRELTLPDGSTLELNTDSVVKIDYGLFCRCINVLWGEAYFQVEHNEDPRPFRVVAGSGVVYDLGTAFVVRQGAKNTHVGVLEGAVRVRTAQFRHVLRHGDVLTFDNKGALLDIGHQQAADLAAWRRGKLVFRDTPLPRALREFARYRQLTLKLDPQLYRIHINGTYPANDLPQFLGMLQKAYPLKVVRGEVLRIEYRD